MCDRLIRTILFLLLILPSLIGCHVLHIPSYRVAGDAMGNSDYGDCPPGTCGGGMIGGLPIPALPTPGWLAKWKEKRELPDPPNYPRFHPLPTRPMFDPRPGQASIGSAGLGYDSYLQNGSGQGVYGAMPREEQWNAREEQWNEGGTVVSPPSEAPLPAPPVPPQ
jgi:hypothetical protein